MMQKDKTQESMAQNGHRFSELTCKYGPTANAQSVTAVAAASCLRPYGRCNKLLSPHRSTPPDAFARDHDWQQVSWLAGRRLGPPSQRFVGLQWYLWSSANRLQLRGQPRICLPEANVPHSLG